MSSNAAWSIFPEEPNYSRAATRTQSRVTNRLRARALLAFWFRGSAEVEHLPFSQFQSLESSETDELSFASELLRGYSATGRLPFPNFGFDDKLFDPVAEDDAELQTWEPCVLELVIPPPPASNSSITEEKHVATLPAPASKNVVNFQLKSQPQPQQRQPAARTAPTTSLWSRENSFPAAAPRLFSASSRGDGFRSQTAVESTASSSLLDVVDPSCRIVFRNGRFERVEKSETIPATRGSREKRSREGPINRENEKAVPEKIVPTAVGAEANPVLQREQQIKTEITEVRAAAAKFLDAVPKSTWSTTFTDAIKIALEISGQK